MYTIDLVSIKFFNELLLYWNYVEVKKKKLKKQSTQFTLIR